MAAASRTTSTARNRPPALAVFGEFFFDLVFYHLPATPRLGEEVKTDSFFEAPGGGLATTALAARKLGTATAILTRVGEDALSRPAWQGLARQGLDTAACEVRRGASTALTACITWDHDRMMVTHDAINRDIEELLNRPKVLARLQQAKHVHIACPPRSPRLWQPLLRDLRERGITLSADTGWNPDLNPTRLRSILRHCHFLFPNDREALALTGASTVEKALQDLQRWADYPVIKMGAEGSMMAAGGETLHVPALDVPFVDATGAGDAFDGGFLHAWLRRSSWRDCLRAGNICGGMAVTAPGGSAGLPTRAQFHQLLKTKLR